MKTIAIIDPPYGIDVVNNNGKIGASNLAQTGTYSKVIGDNTTETAEKVYNLLISLGIDQLVIWGGNYFHWFLTT